MVYRAKVLERAISEILSRARQLVRHAARPTRVVEAGWPSAGELDLDRTLEGGPARALDKQHGPKALEVLDLEPGWPLTAPFQVEGGGPGVFDGPSHSTGRNGAKEPSIRARGSPSARIGGPRSEAALHGPGWPTPGGAKPPAPRDVIVTRREPKDVDVVAILDMSLSMTGEKIALVALATAILRMKLEHVCVVAFDTQATVLVRRGERVTIRELVRRVLEVPAQGYTNIEAGLIAGVGQLGASKRRDRVGILFTDGCANVGADPIAVAARFPRLHVVHLGHHNVQGSRACQAMASAGRGRVFRALTYQDLPRVVRDAVRELFRT